MFLSLLKQNNNNNKRGILGQEHRGARLGHSVSKLQILE